MKIRCPQCGNIAQVPPQLSGKQTPCPQCNTWLSIPRAKGRAGSSADSPGTGAPAKTRRPSAGNTAGIQQSGRAASRYRNRAASAADARAAVEQMKTGIRDFWEETLECWLEGRIAAVIPECRDVAAEYDVATLQAEFSGKDGKCIQHLLTNYGPLRGEFFCGGDEKWCALTNYRLVQMDGPSKRYYVIPLTFLTGEVDEKGWWTKTATYHFTNGRTLTASKAGAFIPDSSVQAVRALGDWEEFDDSMALLIGNVDPDSL